MFEEVDEELLEEFEIWKLIVRQVASWDELVNVYTVEDVIKANDVLNIVDEISEIQNPPSPK